VVVRHDVRCAALPALCRVGGPRGDEVGGRVGLIGEVGVECDLGSDGDGGGGEGLAEGGKTEAGVVEEVCIGWKT
jgi:hypothetical protein